MKKMKRLVALALSVVMVLAMSVVAFAAETKHRITVKDTDDHSYAIYQIFTGDFAKNTLSNVKWGINGTGTTGDAVDDSTLKSLTDVNSKSEREILEVVENHADLINTDPVATVDKDTPYEAVPGYYLIKDAAELANTDTYTTYIVKVVGENVEIVRKANVPSFEKKIKDTNDTTGDTTDWQDSADYDIGDQVPFKLEGTVASNYDAYKTYYFAFHDKEETGLTFNRNSVKVYVDNTEIKTGFTVNTGEDVLETEETEPKCTFEVVFNNLKDLKDVNNDSLVKAGSKIRVEYTSELNSAAVLGSQGNVNKAKLVFSNNPKNEQVGKPDKPGETPWDNVIVFTYKVVVNKVDEKQEPLKGAEFTLSKKLKDGTTKDIAVVKGDNGTSFTFRGLDDGDYILRETKTPAEYNTMKDITFTVTANHEIQWPEDKVRTDILTSLTGNAASGEITFSPVNGTEEEGNAANAGLSTTVINKKGSSLPSTGGIGTTIFYVVGGILMAGAAVLLITKRRAEN